MKPNPGHYIIDTLHENFKALKKKHPNINITIRWTPGHEGIEGNENADEEAKKVITAGSSDVNTLPKMLKKPLPHSKSAIRWAYSEKLKKCAQKLWEMSPQYEQMKKTEPKAPSNRYLELIAPLPRKIASILMQLRIGHIPLAKHLHHIGKAESPICPECSQNEETVEHFLVHCPKHEHARQTLRSNTGGRNIDIKKILTNPKSLQALFKYIAATRRLHNMFGEIPTLKEKQTEK
jgi:hypothetical protein